MTVRMNFFKQNCFHFDILRADRVTLIQIIIFTLSILYMITAFSKYQGTGNDFVIIDQFNSQVDFTNDQLRFLCNRRFGIGADGVMLLRPSETADFEMVYYNSDGNISSMCGNGGRCLIHFAYSKGYIKEKATFEAIDGLHDGEIDKSGIVSLHMNDVKEIDPYGNALLLDTGSPHYVRFEQEVETLDIVQEGRLVRYNNDFNSEGINVNLVELCRDGIYVRTYERGVEDETLSCGTGVTASVIAAAVAGMIEGEECNVGTKGGSLRVKYQRNGNEFSDIWLIGPATFVFSGEIKL
jgi:diaminopimelate epimerase